MDILCDFCSQEVDKSAREIEKSARYRDGLGMKHYCSRECYKKSRVKPRLRLFKKCKKCKNIHSKPGDFCCRKCANGRIQTKENNEKRSRKIKAWLKNNPDNKIKTIQRNATDDYFTSKGERIVRKYFISSFEKDYWNFGLFHTNEEIFSVDLYCKKLKVIIEYDGIWHFKDIKGQLAHKQRKDALLENWCKENNWRLIRIKDEIFLKDKEIWLERLRKEVYEGVKQIVKFY